MRAVVIGGGVIGVTSAYELQKQGFEVSIVDRRSAENGIASNVNAGLISPGHTLPWASPAMFRRIPAVVLNRTPQLRVRSRTDPELIRWGLSFIAECRTANSRASTMERTRLSLLSRDAFLETVDDTGIDLDIRRGMLFVHSDMLALEAQSKALEIVREQGAIVEMIGAAEAVDLEPALAESAENVAGAIHHRDGLTASCSEFVTKLRQHCAAQGMAEYEGMAERIEPRNGSAARVVLQDGQVLKTDVVVLAAGAHSKRLASKIGRIDTYPVLGHGFTFRGAGRPGIPSMGGVDEANLIAWSRSGDSLRVTGIAEFNRGALAVNSDDIDHVRNAIVRRFPAVETLGEPEIQSGFRPVTPDGLPRIHQFSNSGIFVNTGHGNLGWTMACGSARVLAKLVSA